MKCSRRSYPRVMASLTSWLFAALVTGLVGVPTVHASKPGSAEAVLLARDVVRRQLEDSLQGGACCLPLAPLVSMQRQARVGFTTLFTSERGSWPFEFIGHTGLFALIADYQPEHPRAVQISAGSMTLETLTRQIGNPDVIRPFREGYLLSYPLIVSTNARLDITDTSLYLSGSAGALIINRGAMVLRNATVQPWQAEDVARQLDVFRPFILGWAGSQMFVHDSQLNNLGYQAHLSTGITLARHESQIGGPDAELTVTGSRFTRMAVPLTAIRARLAIENSEFNEGLLNELHVLDSQLKVQGSRFTGTTIGSSAQSTIRIQGDSNIWIHDNQIEHARKAAIELTEVTGRVLITDNRIKNTEGDGLLVSGSAVVDTPVTVKGNSIQHSQRSAIDATGPGLLLLAENTLANSGRYALSYRNESLDKASKLVLLENHLFAAGEALIRTRRVSTLGLYGNRLSLAAYRNQVFAGDSAPFQAALMRGLARQHCDLELIRNPEQTTLMAYPVTVDQAQGCTGELISSGYW